VRFCWQKWIPTEINSDTKLNYKELSNWISGNFSNEIGLYAFSCPKFCKRRRSYAGELDNSCSKIKIDIALKLRQYQ
jgi:hypothetical protein